MAKTKAKASAKKPVAPKAGAKKSVSKSPAKAPAKAKAPTAETILAAYEAHLADAAKVDARDVTTFHNDAQVAYQNALALTPHRAQIGALAGFDAAAAFEAPSIALGLLYAVSQVTAPASAGVRQAMVRAQALRVKLLNAADALVDAGLLPAATVSPLHHHKGGLEHAKDLGALAGLFKKQAAKIAGKTAITSAQIDEALTLSTSLAGTLQPSGTRKDRRAKGDEKAAMDTRDRFAVLLDKRWSDLWRAAAFLVGPHAIDAFAPALYGAPKVHHKAKPAPAPTPAKPTS